MSAPPTPATPRDAGEMARRAREFLERKGVAEARLEADLLVAHALGLTRLALFLALDRPVTSAEIEAARALLVRRGKREPLAYIRGEREFYGRSFRVGPGVLVPRPETELLVDLARELARARADAGRPLARAADFGTGSGALAVTLALSVAGLELLAVDRSEEALRYARLNAAHLGATVEFALGDGFETLQASARARGRAFDLVVANPPYVDPGHADDLAPEVRDHEPTLALFAPLDDPDHFVRRLLEDSGHLLAPGGTLYVELGHDQAPRVRVLAEERGLAVRFHRDLAGIERVVECQRALAADDRAP